MDPRNNATVKIEIFEEGMKVRVVEVSAFELHLGIKAKEEFTTIGNPLHEIDLRIAGKLLTDKNID